MKIILLRTVNNSWAKALLEKERNNAPLGGYPLIYAYAPKKAYTNLGGYPDKRDVAPFRTLYRPYDNTLAPKKACINPGGYPGKRDIAPFRTLYRPYDNTLAPKKAYINLGGYPALKKTYVNLGGYPDVARRLSITFPGKGRVRAEQGVVVSDSNSIHVRAERGPSKESPGVYVYTRYRAELGLRIAVLKGKKRRKTLSEEDEESEEELGEKGPRRGGGRGGG
ncbi:hypothetical protein QBC39DRAFT_330602 [Podospora conica]|nr:hypothetical protein QBC39DRAFT_330602 [Schizothecium conicum]